MNKVRQIHRAAMKYAQLAVTEQDPITARELWGEALKFEECAVEEAERQGATGLPMAVLCRSAAAMALRYGRPRRARLHIDKGLRADPPIEIRAELEALEKDLDGHGGGG